jgi:hypothetical protein
MELFWKGNEISDCSIQDRVAEDNCVLFWFLNVSHIENDHTKSQCSNFVAIFDKNFNHELVGGDYLCCDLKFYLWQGGNLVFGLVLLGGNIYSNMIFG